jgi:hypothetical protein
MHGLVNRAIERFTRDTYGEGLWLSVAKEAGLDFVSFEAMLFYDGHLTGKVVGCLASALEKTQEEVLEDIGTYLVASPNMGALRRLLRFGGADFVEFLYSLDDLPARALLAVPELVIPQLELREQSDQSLSLHVKNEPGEQMMFGHVMLGLLRAMADDYGALVFLEHRIGSADRVVIEITLLEVAFAEARAFELSAQAG